MRIDDEGVGVDDQSIAVGSRARYRLIGDGGADLRDPSGAALFFDDLGRGVIGVNSNLTGEKEGQPILRQRVRELVAGIS